MSALKQEFYTPQQYLEMERKAEYKSEYINGCILPLHRSEDSGSQGVQAMAGASYEHNLITLNVGGTLHHQLKGRPCFAATSDLRVQISEAKSYTYPDVAVVCGEPQFADEHLDTLLNPTVLLEVLSPSTQSYDRNEKAEYYRRLASVSEYVLIAQDRMQVEYYARRDEGWLFTERNAPDDVLRLPSIGCELTLRDIYDKVQFPEQPHSRAPLPPGAWPPQNNGTIKSEEDA